jgi:hypothetical protein
VKEDETLKKVSLTRAEKGGVLLVESIFGALAKAAGKLFGGCALTVNTRQSTKTRLIRNSCIHCGNHFSLTHDIVVPQYEELH